jgi:hypothetical protein
VVDSLYITKGLELDNPDGKALVEVTTDSGDNGIVRTHGVKRGQNGQPDTILQTAAMGGGWHGGVDFGAALSLYGENQAGDVKTKWVMDSIRMSWFRNNIEQWHDPQ